MTSKREERATFSNASILNSACRAEHSKLRTAERLVKLLAIFCVLGWRTFWLTMMNRSTRHGRPALVFTALEVDLLGRLIPDHKHARSRAPPSPASRVTRLARLGGYLDRAGDAPPGNMVIWRGLSRLTDIELGLLFGAQMRAIESMSGRLPQGQALERC